MAEQSVAVRIRAIDNITAPMTRIASMITGAFRGIRNAAGLASSAINAIGTAMRRAVPLAAGLGISGGLLAKSFLGASMELEGYRAKLEVATKSSAAAAEMMAWAQEFAAKTPFEMSGVVDAATRLELYGLSAKHWLPLVGDMAGAMGKDVTQAVEAIADAVSGGGLERLKEFGVTSAKLQAAGWTGSYVDEEGIASLTSALETIMTTQFGGGMEKMMNTATGALSNFQDAVFNVRAALGNALLPVLKQVMPILVQWAEALAAKLREVGPAITTWLIEKLQILFEWVQQNGPALLEFVRGLGEWLWKAAQIGWQGLTWLITKAREIASVFMEVVWPAIVDFATMVRDTFVPILVEEFGGAADSASGFIRSLAEAVAGFLNTLTQNLPSLAETFGEFVRSWKDAFLPVVEQLVQELLPQFLAIAQALVPVILDLANALLPVMDFIGGITKSGLAPLMRIIEPLSEGNYMKAAAAFVTAPQYGSYNTLRMGYQGAESVAQGMQQRGQRQAQYQAAMATINNNIYLDGRRVAQTVNNQNQIASRECSRF